jgi:hypothetical protein
LRPPNAETKDARAACEAALMALNKHKRYQCLAEWVGSDRFLHKAHIMQLTKPYVRSERRKSRCTESIK